MYSKAAQPSVLEPYMAREAFDAACREIFNQMLKHLELLSQCLCTNNSEYNYFCLSKRFFAWLGKTTNGFFVFN